MAFNSFGDPQGEGAILTQSYAGEKNTGSGGIRTHAIEMTGALNQRLRPLGHTTTTLHTSIIILAAPIPPSLLSLSTILLLRVYSLSILLLRVYIFLSCLFVLTDTHASPITIQHSLSLSFTLPLISLRPTPDGQEWRSWSLVVRVRDGEGADWEEVDTSCCRFQQRFGWTPYLERFAPYAGEPCEDLQWFKQNFTSSDLSLSTPFSISDQYLREDFHSCI